MRLGLRFRLVYGILDDVPLLSVGVVILAVRGTWVINEFLFLRWFAAAFFPFCQFDLLTSDFYDFVLVYKTYNQQDLG